MIVGKKQYRKYNDMKVDILILAILLIFVFSSILLKSNILLLIEMVFIGVLVILYIYVNDKRLMIFSILGILLAPTFSVLNESLNNISYFVIILLFMKLVEKIILKQRIRFDKIIILLTTILFIINVLSLIYNKYDINIIGIIIYSFKKFSFLIVYVFFINADVTKKDFRSSLNLFIIFGLMQFAIVVIQFAIGIRQDDLSGMFGKSATGVMIQFISIILILITVYKDKLKKLFFLDLIIVIFSLIYSAMGEVKVGFIIMPCIYLLTLLLKGKKANTIIAMFVIFFSFSITYSYLMTLYPGKDVIFNINDSEDYLKNAYGSEEVNRIGFLPLLNSTIINTTEKQLFGTGLGTINPSKSDKLQGSLMKRYGYMNIYFFALPYSITESGLVGTFIWLMIYIYIFIINIKEYLFNKSNKSIVNIMLIIDVSIFLVYNSSIFESFPIILFVWFMISYFNNKKLNSLYIEN